MNLTAMLNLQLKNLLNSTDIQAQKDTNKDGLFTIKTRNFKDNEFEEMKDMLVKDYKAVDDKQNFTILRFQIQ